MNPLQRTIHEIIETDIPNFPRPNISVEKLKAFQLIKYTTGKRRSDPNIDYSIEQVDSHYGYDSIIIKGKRGFIRVTLTPLFQII